MGALNGSNGPRAIGYWGSVDGWEESDTASVATAEGGVNGGGAGADNRIPETGRSIVVRALYRWQQNTPSGPRLRRHDRGARRDGERPDARPPARAGGGGAGKKCFLKNLRNILTYFAFMYAII